MEFIPRYTLAEARDKRDEARKLLWDGIDPSQAKKDRQLQHMLKIETRGALDITHRAMQTCGKIFRYAIITGRAKYNPSIDLCGALKSPGKSNHAYLEAAELPEFLSKLRAYDGHI